MKAFLGKFGDAVRGVLNGFDRLFFRGTLRNLSYPMGLQNYLWANRIKFKHFDEHSKTVTSQLEEASLRHAQESNREIRFLNSSKIGPEAEAQKIAARDGITNGLICVLRRTDPCMSFEIHRNRSTKKLQIKYRRRQGMHLYHYQIHPVFGFMHARIQTWFPFHAYVCINGHEWLARQMDQAGLHYQRRDNCFTWVEDMAKAQELFNQQLKTHWQTLLNELAAAVNPIHQAIFAQYPTDYYWSVAQTEWSSDVLFRRRADLQAMYPRLVRHAITTYGPVDILRYFGRKIREGGQVPEHFHGEVESNLKHGADGVRVKHWCNHNSLKLYDKGSVLRPEVTINDPEDFRVFRPKEGAPDGPKAWLPMRYGVADLYRRAEVSQAANERYLEALAAVQDTTPVRALAEPLCRPALEPRKVRAQAAPENVGDGDNDAVAPFQGTPMASSETIADPGAPLPGAEPSVPATTSLPAQPTVPVEKVKQSKRRRLRALNPLSVDDSNLLETVSRHEFLINGLRNRDVRRLLFPTEATSTTEERRRSAAVSRKLRLLRAHSLLRKVPGTHRYMVSANGRKAITALLAARDANADFLITNAA
jgi:hypothetical protein